jgi:hypothetical protein
MLVRRLKTLVLTLGIGAVWVTAGHPNATSLVDSSPVPQVTPSDPDKAAPKFKPNQTSNQTRKKQIDEETHICRA